MKNWTPLMWLYLAFAIAGIIVPWYFNLQFMMYGDEPFTIRRFLADGMATPLSSSITTDFFISSTPVLIWMMIEGKRLKMKRLWFYFIFTFMIAFAFTCPFFLFMRERKIRLGT